MYQGVQERELISRRNHSNTAASSSTSSSSPAHTRADGDEVDGSDVDRIEHVRLAVDPVRRHRKSLLVMQKVVVVFVVTCE